MSKSDLKLKLNAADRVVVIFYTLFVLLHVESGGSRREIGSIENGIHKS